MTTVYENKCMYYEKSRRAKKSILPRIISDHLGSIRVVLTETGNVDSWSDYYPFGKESRGSSTSNEPKEQFTGKERDIEIGLDYFGARYYNAEIGRWTSKDPLAEKYPGLSPYNYAANNPMFFVDPNGKEIWVFGEDKKGAFADLQNLVGEGNASRLSVNDDGKVGIDTKGYEKGSNDAMDLLIEIDEAKNSEGENLKIGYAVSNEEIPTDNIDSKGHVWAGAIKNASETHRYIGEDKGNLPQYHGEKPEHGFNGEVTISNNVTFENGGKPYPRDKVVGHELKENLHRTRDKKSYDQSHKESNKKFYGGTKGDPIIVLPKVKDKEK